MGVFRTDDGGTTWIPKNRGVYRSRDGGESWARNQQGLPSTFGFPIVLDAASRFIFSVPLEADQYRLPVGGALKAYRSTDGGDSWHSASAGLPEVHAYGGVLRGAMAVDNLEPGGVYMGTTSGTLHVSRDLGESWTNLPVILPRILHVSAWV